MLRKSVEHKLKALTKDMAQLRSDLEIVNEQLAHFEDEAEDARLRSLVSETPQAAKIYRDAAATAAAFRRDRDHKSHQLKRLEQQQDDLLDQL